MTYWLSRVTLLQSASIWTACLLLPLGCSSDGQTASEAAAGGGGTALIDDPVDNNSAGTNSVASAGSSGSGGSDTAGGAAGEQSVVGGAGAGGEANQLDPNQPDPLDTSEPFERVYKMASDTDLLLYFILPEGYTDALRHPTIIFFFGGGWNSGTPEQFRPQAEYLASRGMLSVLADYRVKERQGTTPFDAVEDAKSAIRYLRQNQQELRIDPERIVASGGSAGGHLAAATGNIEGLDNPNEDLTVSSKPEALVLFNPVYDNGPDGYGYERIGDAYPTISPIDNITVGAPPTVVFLGTEDALIPVATAERYCDLMEAVGSRCDLFLYEGASHGFFNYNANDPTYYNATLFEADVFLASLGYICGPPTIAK